MLCAGAFIGGFVNGLAGFGTALFALGFFLNVMPPVQAVAIILVMSFSSGLLGMWTVRKDIAPNVKPASYLILPGLCGVPFGVYSLAYVDVDMLRLLVASLLLLYGGYFSSRGRLPNLAGDRPIMDVIIGFASGILGGLASLSGALPTMWFAMRDRNKHTMRTIIQSFNMSMFVLAMTLFWWNGAYNDNETLFYCLITIIVSFGSAKLGIIAFNYLNDYQFRRLLVFMTLVSGIIMMGRILLAG